MKLLTKELIQRFKEVGSQEEVSDPIVIAKFFNSLGAGVWYATEYDPDAEVFFGFVSISGDWNDEWGWFSQAELEGYHGKFGTGIERDLYFTEQPISKLVPHAKG
jgi:hypothetical protein